MDALISQPLHVLGAGRVGRTLAIRAHSAGQPIGIVVSSTLDNAEDACRVIGAGTPRASLPPDVKGVVLATVPDRLIATIAASGRADAPRELVWIHTAGALGVDALGEADAGGPRAAVHPLSAFADPQVSADRFPGTPCVFESDESLDVAISEWVIAIGGSPVRLNPGTKARYHAAATMSVTGAMVAADAAIQLLQSCGLDEAESRALLLPLLRANVENLASSTPAQALTGPIQRGDAATIQAHLADVSAWPPDSLELYRALLGMVSDLAQRGGTKPELLEAIRLLAQDQ